ncbi:CBU_0592 family membrane protein [Lentisalinibacter sediminis]|uniref:CBU_0592 family membrane protein n=1 Tax=Lentisalinibacter sediminis TaxID=2992237 RepID=UPI003867F116
MNYAWHDLIGNAGVALIILAYLLLQLDRLSSTALTYSVMNALGAALVIISLYFDFNLSAFVIEAFWVVISLVGIGRWWMKKAGEAP